jgi:hypothetical protein
MCINIFSVFLIHLLCLFDYCDGLAVADLQKTIKENHVSAFLCHDVAEAGPRKTLSQAFFWVKSPGYKLLKVGLGYESKRRISETIFITS